jgi:N-acyl-D-aspartate/D-glutamate deacylase
VRSAKGASAPTVLRVGRLVDGTGGRARERAELRIVDGRIDAIGDHGSLV